MNNYAPSTTPNDPEIWSNIRRRIRLFCANPTGPLLIASATTPAETAGLNTAVEAAAAVAAASGWAIPLLWTHVDQEVARAEAREGWSPETTNRARLSLRASALLEMPAPYDRRTLKYLIHSHERLCAAVDQQWREAMAELWDGAERA